MSRGPTAGDAPDRHALDEGAELFERGAYFEAHDVWEEAWRPLPHGPVREGLQGLIQAAVALHHRANGNAHGAHALGRRAVARLDRGPARLHDLDLVSIRRDLPRVIDGELPPEALRLRPER